MSTYRGVTVPEQLLPNEWELSFWKQGVDAALAVALPVVDRLYDETECSLDHHGYCQEHGHLSEGPCPDGAAQELMTRASLPTTVWRALVGTGDGTDWYWCSDHRPAVSVLEVPVSEIHPSVTVQCTHCGVTVR